MIKMAIIQPIFGHFFCGIRGVEAKTMTNQKFLTVENLAKQLQVSPKTIYKLCNERKVPHLWIEGKIRFCPEQIKWWAQTWGEVTFFAPKENAQDQASVSQTVA